MTYFSKTKAEYDAQKVSFEGVVDVYRTAPDEAQRILPRPKKRVQSLTIYMRHNYDLRDYLITRAGLGLEAVPHEVIGNYSFELWKEAEDPHRAFYFFDLLFVSDASEEVRSTLKKLGYVDSPEEKLSTLRKLGYVMVRNEMAREWEDYDEKETEMKIYFER